MLRDYTEVQLVFSPLSRTVKVSTATGRVFEIPVKSIFPRLYIQLHTENGRVIGITSSLKPISADHHGPRKQHRSTDKAA